PADPSQAQRLADLDRQLSDAAGVLTPEARRELEAQRAALVNSASEAQTGTASTSLIDDPTFNGRVPGDSVAVQTCLEQLQELIDVERCLAEAILGCVRFDFLYKSCRQQVLQGLARTSLVVKDALGHFSLPCVSPDVMECFMRALGQLYFVCEDLFQEA